MKIKAFLRVSTDKQDLETQRLAILSYAQREGLMIDEFIEITMSSRKPKQKKHFEEVIENLGAGDRLIVSELSRVGRSLGIIVNHINEIVRKQINFVAIKENLKVENGKQDIQSKILVGMFGLFAEVERDLISERTKEGMVKAKAAGKRVGRPKGRTSKSKLDGSEALIAEMLDDKASKAYIARKLKVSINTLKAFIKKKNLEGGGLISF